MLCGNEWGKCGRTRLGNFEYVFDAAGQEAGMQLEQLLPFRRFKISWLSTHSCHCCEKLLQRLGGILRPPLKHQCPVSFSTTAITSVATSLVCCASGSPNDFSPPIVSTGMVSLVWES